MVSRSRLFKKRVVLFAESGNEPLKKYIALYFMFFFTCAIFVALCLSLFINLKSNSSAVSAANTMLSSFVGAYFTLRIFYKKYSRLFSEIEFKRIIKHSVLWIVLAYSVFFAVIIPVLSAHYYLQQHTNATAVPLNEMFNLFYLGMFLAVMVMVTLIVWLITWWGYKCAMLSIQQAQEKKSGAKN